MLRTNLSSSISMITVPDTPITILPIPDITLNVGETHDMSQYIIDQRGLRTSTQINGVPSFVSYDSGTELLTGVTPGTDATLTLEVFY